METNYKGVKILVHQHSGMRSNEKGKDSHPEKYYFYTAETDLGAIGFDSCESKTPEESLDQIKGKIDMLDMLIARNINQLVEYLKETICYGEDGDSNIHPVLMNMVLGNSRIPKAPTEPVVMDKEKTWWEKLVDWFTWGGDPQYIHGR